MNGKESIEILKEQVMPIVQQNVNLSQAVVNSVNALIAIEIIKDLIFKYRCSAVTMRNQKTYFTDHDVGYCEGACEVFEEVDRDIESILKNYKVL